VMAVAALVCPGGVTAVAPTAIASVESHAAQDPSGSPGKGSRGGTAVTMKAAQARPDFEALVAAAHRRIPGLTVTTDLIAGFPGETEEMFLKTKEFVAEYKNCITVSIQPMMVIKNSLVGDKPGDFGLAPGSNSLKWQTIDGANTYDVRLQRVEALRSVLDGRLITIDK